MNLLHSAGDDPPDYAADKSWSLFKLLHTLNAPRERLGVREKGLNEFAPADVTQQVVRVVACLQIPLLTLAMLQAELTHYSPPFGFSIDKSAIQTFILAAKHYDSIGPGAWMQGARIRSPPAQLRSPRQESQFCGILLALKIAKTRICLTGY
jgi:hypothetical protein